MKNVIRFNYPVYLAAVAGLGIAAALLPFATGWMRVAIAGGMLLSLLQLLLSLAATAYAYDLSGFYNMDFLPPDIPEGGRILNISAGFDETSGIIAARFPGAKVQPYDFFDAGRHTESSIRRARNSHPPAPGTRLMTTASLPEASMSADLICLILAAHEIRDGPERQLFFGELMRVLKPEGRVIVAEHLRDAPNVLAYNFGALHFFPGRRWESDFEAASLSISDSQPANPFIHIYTLKRAALRA